VFTNTALPPVGSPGTFDVAFLNQIVIDYAYPNLAPNMSIAFGGGGGGALPPRGHPGDADMDGAVDVADLSVVLTNYNQTGMTWVQGDFDFDGVVTINDLSNVLTNYDKTFGASASFRTVPEPSSLALVGIGVMGLLAYARRGRRT
jgi:hypothetical protein